MMSSNERSMVDIIRDRIREKDKLEKRISEINGRIYDIIARQENEMSNSEVKKLEKVKIKLFKEKNKLISKLNDYL